MPDAEEIAQQALSPEQERELLLETARRDFLFYIKACDPKYIASRVHVFLARKLQDVAEGRCKRLIISCPPRVGKSKLCCIEFPSWLLGRDPTQNVVIGSYAQALANLHSRETRRRLQDSDVYHAIFPNTKVYDGDARLDDWGTAEGGRYKSVGVGSGITGRGASLMVLDDLVKDFQEAQSQIVQDGIFSWLQSTALTRLAPGAPVILIMTRWGVSDPVGRIMSPEFQNRLKDAGVEGADAWEVINLPAICDEADDLLGRQIGESIFPERFSSNEYAKIKAERGAFAWASLYCGRPTALGGNYIKVDKVIIVDAIPKGIRLFRYWDLAASEKKSADYTASVIGGIEAGTNNFYIDKMIRGQWEWPKARDRIIQTASIERVHVGVEAVSGFKTAFSNLTELMPKDIMCSEYGADKDKMTRALPWIALCENGKLHMVRGDWNIDCLMEMEAWPKGRNDDIEDAISGVFAMAKSGEQYIMPVTLGVGKHFDRTNRTLIG